MFFIGPCCFICSRSTNILSNSAARSLVARPSRVCPSCLLPPYEEQLCVNSNFTTRRRVYISTDHYIYHPASARTNLAPFSSPNMEHLSQDVYDIICTHIN